jgi:hypothetical protein
VVVLSSNYGAQDIYISGNPQITFWKILYKRHTNFAVESIEVTFNGQADFNKRVTAVINRNADLMYKTYVQVVLPAIDLTVGGGTFTASAGAGFRWLNYIGHRLLKQVEIEIGGQRIDRQYGDWMQIWTQLSTEAGNVKVLDSMIGNTHDLVLTKRTTGVALDATCSSSDDDHPCVPRKGTPAKTLYIPSSSGSAATRVSPSRSLPCSTTRCASTWTSRPGSNVLSTTRPTTGVPTAGARAVPGRCLDLRRLRLPRHGGAPPLRPAVAPSTSIEQVQYTGAESITSSSNKIQLNFNHPVKELHGSSSATRSLTARPPRGSRRLAVPSPSTTPTTSRRTA